MEDVIMEERWNLFDEQFCQYYYHDDSVDMADLVLESDSTHSPFTPWNDLLQDNGTQDFWSTSEIHTVEEEFLQIIYSTQKSEESEIQSESRKNSIHSCSGNQEAVNHDYSSGNTNVSFDCNGSMSFSNTDSEEYKGLRLVHLLTACAEAISHGTHDLVETIFCRLTELVSPTGSTMERAAYYLSQSLRQTHIGIVGVIGDRMCKHVFKTHENGTRTKDPNYIGAFSLLNMVYPYIRFAHFTANQSILEAIPAQAHTLHILDFDIMEGLQWPPLMEALKSDSTHKLCALKLTAVKWHNDDDDDHDDHDDHGGDDSEPFKDTGRRLSEYASSLGIPFSFEEIELENLRGKLRRDDNEVFAVNCMWELPHMRKRSKKQLAELFNGVRDLKPVVLTVGSGPVGMDNHENLDFLERFSECLRTLCAVFDSTQVGLPDKFGLARSNVENLFLGPMICRSINYIPDNQETDSIPVMDLAVRSGFIERDISRTNIMYAKYMLASSEAGRLYAVELMGKHQLLLKWNSTCLTCVSSFTGL
ncbi:hypothetical protein SUGI_0130350 [Cryptomeria japonica]|uniref:protein NODULATION SIGNALING PATHWAY 2 n=1 Tax=Cryptomeria japonica TaxID=3369 RepID=UPI002408C0AA|nr:protein NODULATION SIGNALING PATHWAY 2 [Cryptomeria japonica]GLJ10551.1 hypothetical protein SUGI_0130350 [Cryptomeria japonica]